jgi:hypothetical protein
LMNIDKSNTILCLSSRNMIDKTMCEVLWRNISDFYVNLRVEVRKHPQVQMNTYNIDFFYMHLFTMRCQCVLNRSSNQDAHYSKIKIHR